MNLVPKDGHGIPSLSRWCMGTTGRVLVIMAILVMAWPITVAAHGIVFTQTRAHADALRGTGIVPARNHAASNSSELPTATGVNGVRAAGATGAWSQAQLPVPSGVDSATLVSVACPGSGRCTAVGTGSGPGLGPKGVRGSIPLAWDEIGGMWRVTDVPLPIPGWDGNLSSVACSDPGDCVAIGYYLDTEDIFGLIAYEDNGVWRSEQSRVPPNGFMPGSDGYRVNLDSVACQIKGTCVIFGEYNPNAKIPVEAFAESVTDGSLQIRDLPVPSGTPPTYGAVELESLAESCPPTGPCTAEGQENYVTAPPNSAIEGKDFVASGNGTSWQTSQFQVTPGTTTFLSTGAAGLSCPAAGYCVTDGKYETRTSGPTHGVIAAQEAGGAFAAQAVVFPPGQANSNTYFNTVSCAAKNVCAAGGHYVDGAGLGRGFIELLDGSHWSYAIPPAPSGAAAEPRTAFQVGCSTNGYCAAQGGYNLPNGNRVLGLYVGSGTKWTPQATQIPNLAPPTGNLGNFAPAGVSCGDDGSCAAAGDYTTSGESYRPYIFVSDPIGLAVSDVTVDKPVTGSAKAEFDVTLNPPSSKPVTVDLATEDGTAKAGRDYVGLRTMVTLSPGSTEATVPVEIIGGEKTGPPLHFSVKLSHSSSVHIATPVGTGTINASPKVSVDDLAVERPYVKDGKAEVAITLNRPATQATSVDYTTQDGTAVAGHDYRTSSGTVSFPAGATRETVPLTLLVNPDAPAADDESFSVRLSNPNPTWLELAKSTATITMTTKVTVNSVSPDTGSPAGGSTITIKGTGFGPPGAGDASVLFCNDPKVSGCPANAWSATTVRVVSESEIQAVAPPWDGQSTGLPTPFEDQHTIADQQKVGLEVVITPASGSPQHSDPAATSYTYGVTIASVAPKKGPPIGGQDIVINGSGFGPAGTPVSVYVCLKYQPRDLDAIVCPDLTALRATVVSDTRITAATPEFGLSGPASGAFEEKTLVGLYVDLHLPDSKSAVSFQSPYTYAVTTTSISPVTGPLKGGQKVTIHGSGFGPAGTEAQVNFCARPTNGHPACDYEHDTFTSPATVVNDTTITTTTPNADAYGTPGIFSYELGVEVEIDDSGNIQGPHPEIAITDPGDISYTFTCKPGPISVCGTH